MNQQRWKTSLVLLFMAFSAIAFGGTALGAESFRERQIHIIVPYPPGGPNDLLGRMLAESLSERLGTRAIVDNKPGASGTIGANFAARSRPDGNTLLIAAPSSTTINASLLPNMPFDPIRDFSAVGTIATGVLMLVVNPSLPARTVQELISLAKKRPKELKLTFGSSGNGSAAHLAGALFMSMAGIDMMHVPYKGGAPAMTDLLGGHIDLIFSDITIASSHVRAGKLRPLGVTGSSRSLAFPDMPTIAESGVTGYEVVTWFGVLAPAGTPQDIIGTLNQEIQRMVTSPNFRERLKPLGAEPAPSTPESFQALLKKDVEKWAKVIKESGARAE